MQWMDIRDNCTRTLANSRAGTICREGHPVSTGRGLDLTKEEFDEALEATNRRRAESKNKKPTGVPDGPEIRRVRGKTPQRALLLLYPLSPKVAKLNLTCAGLRRGGQLSGLEQRPGRQLPFQYGRTATGTGMTSLREELRRKWEEAAGHRSQVTNGVASLWICRVPSASSPLSVNPTPASLSCSKHR